MAKSTCIVKVNSGIIFLVAALAIGFISCGKSFKPLYIKTATFIGDKDTSIVSRVDSDYFEIALQLATEDNGPQKFIAEKKLQKPEVGEPFRLIFFFIPNEDNSKALTFSNSTEFLNYMADRGYEMVDQNKAEYHTDYTFKKID